MRSTECYFQVALSRLQRQDEMNRDLESKAGRSIAGATAIMGAATLPRLVAPASVASSIGEVAVALTVIMAVAFLGTLSSSLMVLWPREWRNDPDLMIFKTYVPGQDSRIVKWAGNQLSNAVVANENILTVKGRQLAVSMGSLFLMLLTFLLLVFLLIEGAAR